MDKSYTEQEVNTILCETCNGKGEVIINLFDDDGNAITFNNDCQVGVLSACPSCIEQNLEGIEPPKKLKIPTSVINFFKNAF